MRLPRRRKPVRADDLNSDPRAPVLAPWSCDSELAHEQYSSRWSRSTNECLDRAGLTGRVHCEVRGPLSSSNPVDPDAMPVQQRLKDSHMEGDRGAADLIA